MKVSTLQKSMAAIACLGMLVPQSVLAAPRPEVFTDVALREEGLLVGYLVDGQGVAQAGTEVSIQYQQQEIARTITDEQGCFAVQGLRGGEYMIATSAGAAAVRAWAPQTAPPAAKPTLLLVNDGQLVRGQFGILGGMSTTTMIGIGIGLTAVGIGILVATTDDDDDNS